MEIIAVLIILGILAAVAVPRYMAFEANARKKVFNKSINELNALETLEWSDNKISESGYVSDIKIYGAINYDIGQDFTWNAGDPTLTGGTILFKGESFALSRTPSTTTKPAIWNQR